MTQRNGEKFVDKKRHRSAAEEISEAAQVHGPDVAAFLTAFMESGTVNDNRGRARHIYGGTRDENGRLKRGLAFKSGNTVGKARVYDSTGWRRATLTKPNT